jgi:hypothetical protein
LYALAFYGVYTLVRDLQGSASGTGTTEPATIIAARHAREIIRIERDLHIFRERSVQHLFDHAKLFLQFWNTYYGVAHFAVTILVLVWLFRRDYTRYPLFRNALALTTGLALIGFATFPLMPPRLLPQAQYHFVDTLRVFGGPWSFGSGPVERVSNQYAAMPSLHFAWSAWCTCAIYPRCRSRWTKGLAVAYPVITVFAIVVTANHFVLDAVAGAVVFGAGYGLSRLVTPRLAGRRARSELELV